ncbi:MAG: hypothetical protein ACRDOI_36750 [Trebonia sp.]
MIPSGPAAGARAGPGLLFLAQRPQVQVILQQLPQHIPAPAVQEPLQLASRQPGRGRADELDKISGRAH